MARREDFKTIWLDAPEEMLICPNGHRFYAAPDTDGTYICVSGRMNHLECTICKIKEDCTCLPKPAIQGADYEC